MWMGEEGCTIKLIVYAKWKCSALSCDIKIWALRNGALGPLSIWKNFPWDVLWGYQVSPNPVLEHIQGWANTSLGSLFQGLTSLAGKNFLLKCNLRIYFFSLKQFPLVLLLHAFAALPPQLCCSTFPSHKGL